MNVVIDQIGKHDFCVLGSRGFVCSEESFVVIQNDTKIIEEDSSFHLTYQTLMSDD